MSEIRYYKCDKCGRIVDAVYRLHEGTQYRHIPCGGKWAHFRGELPFKDGQDESDKETPNAQVPAHAQGRHPHHGGEGVIDREKVLTDGLLAIISASNRHKPDTKYGSDMRIEDEKWEVADELATIARRALAAPTPSAKGGE